MQATLDPGGPCQPASSAHVAKERDPQNPLKKKARDESSTMAVVLSAEQGTLTCGTMCKTGRGGAEQTQDVSALQRCFSYPDAAAAFDSAKKSKMAHTDTFGNVTNEKALVGTLMDHVDGCFQQAKETGRRKRSRPADKLPEVAPHGRPCARRL